MGSRVDEVFDELKAEAEALGPEIMQPSGKARQRDGYDMLDLACKRITELEAERRWIPVGKSLPPAEVEVLLWFEKPDERVGVPAHEALGYWMDMGEGGVEWVAPYPWTTDVPMFWMPKPKGPEVTDE